MLYDVMITTSLKMTNSILSKLIDEVFYKNHEKTQQEVPNELLLYLYNTYMVCANNK